MALHHQQEKLLQMMSATADKLHLKKSPEMRALFLFLPA